MAVSIGSLVVNGDSVFYRAERGSAGLTLTAYKTNVPGDATAVYAAFKKVASDLFQANVITPNDTPKESEVIANDGSANADDTDSAAG